MLTIQPSVLAKEVLRRIEEYPETHDQRWWVRDSEGVSYYMGFRPKVYEIITNSPYTWVCGTTACVAGHAISAAIELEPNREFLTQSLWTDSIEEIATELFECSKRNDIFSITTTREEVIEWLKHVADGIHADDASNLVLGEE